MLFVKQSTALVIKMGPFLDDTDGKTAEIALTIAQADIQISKNGAALGQTSDVAPTTTHDADGWYPIPLTVTDTGTLGTLTVQVAMAGALPVWRDLMVMPANVWDSMFGADKLQTDAVEISSDSVAADNLESACDGTTYNIGGGAVVAASVTGAVGSVTGAVGSVAGNVSGNVVGSVASVTGAVGNVTGAVGSVTGAVGSVAGNVGGNVVGSVASVTGAVGSVTGNVGGNVTGSVGSLVGHTVQTGDNYVRLGIAGAGLTALPWNAAWDAEVQSECTDALEAAIGTPAANSLAERIKTFDDAYTATRAAYLDELAAANLPADLNAVKVITDALTAAAAAKLALSAAGIVSGAAVAGILSTTQMTTNLTEPTNDHYIGAVIVWTSGALAGQRSNVTDYDGATKMLTYTVTTDPPAVMDTFVII